MDTIAGCSARDRNVHKSTYKSVHYHAFGKTPADKIALFIV